MDSRTSAVEVFTSASAYQCFRRNLSSVLIEFRFDITPNHLGSNWAREQFESCFGVDDIPQSVFITSYKYRVGATIEVSSREIDTVSEFVCIVKEQIARFSRDIFIKAKECSIRKYREHICVIMGANSLLVCNIFRGDNSHEITTL